MPVRSMFAVLFALVFWGWIWGVTGAFVSIPLTAAIIIACAHFPRTHWIATLTSDVNAREQTAGSHAGEGPDRQ